MAPLEPYGSKRDFDRTPEPRADDESDAGSRRRGADGPGGAPPGPSFVVQKHDASRLHYDFRLEWGGVLWSWAVPKGPVPDPTVKRLAVRTEDHPLSYRDFEGVIPAGQYGGGTVMVWDRGVWEAEGDPEKGLEKGHIDFTLLGEKLRGRWTLIRTGEDWLLFKRSDDEARPGSGAALLDERTLSVLTGRSMREIAADRDRVWSSDASSGGSSGGPSGGAPEGGSERRFDGARERRGPKLDPGSVPGAGKVAEMPAAAAAFPRRPIPAKDVPSGDAWLHEILHEGDRLLVEVRAGGIRLTDTTGADRTAGFDRIARAASVLPVASALLDGVAVWTRARAEPDDLFFYAFDLLHLDGYDLTASSLEARKALLADLVDAAPSVLRFSSHVRGEGEAFFREACRLGAPGVVSKRADGVASWEGASERWREGASEPWREVRCMSGRARKSSSRDQAAGVRFTNPDRVLFPEAGITKSDLGLYWSRIVGSALPTLENRPLTLYRCPQGIDSGKKRGSGSDCFYQKHANESVSEKISRIHVPEKSGDPKPEPYMYVDGLASILELVQLGTIEFHVWNARVDRLDRPDTVVLDLDPGPGVAWEEVVGAAVALREMLSELDLASWPRATGGKGLHVVVPMTRRHGWSEAKGFARAVAESMVRAAPGRFVAKADKQLRKGRIYVDWLRNGRNATAIATFSPRARPGAPVAFPLSWDEAEATREPPKLPVSEAMDVDWSARDPWSGYHDVRQSITRGVREALGLG